MLKNLLEAVQIKMGYPALKKIDPNTQEVKAENGTSEEHQFGQAAIPAVLTALYKYSRSDDGADKILQDSARANWTNELFADNKENIIQKINDYSFHSFENAESAMNNIASIAMNIVKAELPSNASIHDVKKFLSGQRDNILLYLPAALQLGEMLNDNSFDDRTNKMEGPVSSMMQAVGRQFSDN